jgi:hypothetical protein
MRTRPTGTELLPVAQTVLRESIVPYVGAGEIAAVHDVAAALALAARTLDCEQPAGRVELEMLKTARATLRRCVLDRLPKERQYDARLVAKVIAIATSEIENGNAPERDELDRLAHLLREAPQADGTARDVHRRLTQLYERLSADIRAGQIDHGGLRYGLTYAHLCKIARQAVSESNPAYLEQRSNDPNTVKDAL